MVLSTSDSKYTSTLAFVFEQFGLSKWLVNCRTIYAAKKGPFFENEWHFVKRIYGTHDGNAQSNGYSLSFASDWVGTGRLRPAPAQEH